MGETVAVACPATGKQIGSVPRLTDEMWPLPSRRLRRLVLTHCSLIATKSYAEAAPEKIGRFLVVYLRGWLGKAYPDAANKLALGFKSGGLEVT